MMDLTYYLLATLAVLVSILLWLTNLLSLPGNWGIPIVGLGLAWGFPIDATTGGPGIGWDSVGVLFGLALLGEVLEFVAGAAGAAKQGASRRAIALSLVGSFVVSLVGAVLLGGLASNNKYSLLGGLRSAAQMVSYEVPLGLSVVTGLMVAGTLSMQGIIYSCLLYTSPSPRDGLLSRMPSSA